MELTIEDKTSRALKSASAETKADVQEQINNSEKKTDNKIGQIKTVSDKSLETLTKELDQQRNDFEKEADENAKIA
ncbi:hypothetical protein [Nostoc commune]|uniref:hypothetical protein n=1 Tax=Nostoc commune TaxID=1178 RepID=UPI0018C5E404|nr:hypothetical protein [Nostoc commune]MBG1263094.1 hypothetical protein [Nostoc commune BAE]